MLAIVGRFLKLCAVLAFGGLVLAGCADASLMTTHAPVHPDTDTDVTLKAHAEGRVDKIVISYEVYTLTTGPGGAHVQTLSRPMTEVETCDPPGNVATLDCLHIVPGGFPAARLIKLRAVVTGGNGETRSESYMFAAGTYPWPDDPIPIRVTGDPAKRMDIVFIPDTDLPLGDFRANLAGVIENLYFKYETYRGNDRGVMWRVIYNFYYSGQQGNYEELCQFTEPANVANLQAVGDAIAILHQAPLRDCKVGGIFSSEIDFDKTLIHETGHALFDLRDEYCCDSAYDQQPCFPNLYATLAACQADAPSLGLAASACTKLTDGEHSIEFWRVDPTSTPGCIMGPAQHPDPASTHGPADRRRIDWRRNNCLGGDCFRSCPVPPMPSPAP
jgi:hypothetical protein